MAHGGSTAARQRRRRLNWAKSPGDKRPLPPFFLLNFGLLLDQSPARPGFVTISHPMNQG